MAALSSTVRILRSPAVTTTVCRFPGTLTTILRRPIALPPFQSMVKPTFYPYLSSPYLLRKPMDIKFLVVGIFGVATIPYDLDRSKSNGHAIVLSKSSMPSGTEVDSDETTEEICNEQLKKTIKEEKNHPRGEYSTPAQEVMDLQKEKGKYFGEEALNRLIEMLEKVQRDTHELDKKRECFEKEKEIHWEDVRNRHNALDDERKRLDKERAYKGNEKRCYFASMLKGLEQVFGFPRRLMTLKTTIEEGTVLVTAVYMSLPTVLVLNQTGFLSIVKEKQQELLDKASSLGVKPLPASSTASSHLPASPSSTVGLPLTPPSGSADNVEGVGDDEGEDDE